MWVLHTSKNDSLLPISNRFKHKFHNFYFQQKASTHPVSVLKKIAWPIDANFTWLQIDQVKTGNEVYGWMKELLISSKVSASFKKFGLKKKRIRRLKGIPNFLTMSPDLRGRICLTRLINKASRDDVFDHGWTCVIVSCYRHALNYNKLLRRSKEEK